ncbi:hypothetical protein Tco_1221241 [Tanacetum coccineum]
MKPSLSSSNHLDADIHTEAIDNLMHTLKTGKEGETKYEIKIPEVMLNDLIKEKQAYKCPSRNRSWKIFMKKGNFAVNAGKEKNKIVEDEQRRRDELMARERQTSLIIGREVEKGVDNAYRSDYSRP